MLVQRNPTGNLFFPVICCLETLEISVVVHLPSPSLGVVKIRLGKAPSQV